jgi:hypothetical protein
MMEEKVRHLLFFADKAREFIPGNHLPRSLSGARRIG